MGATEKNVISNDLNQKFIAAFGEEKHSSTEGALRDSLNKAGVADNSMGNLVPLLLSFILHDTKPGANPDESLKDVQKRLDDTRDGGMQTYGGWNLHQNPTASIYNAVEDMCEKLCENIMSRVFGLQGNDPKLAAKRWENSVFPKPSPNSNTAQKTEKSDDDFDEKAAAADYSKNKKADRTRAQVAEASAELDIGDDFNPNVAVDNYNKNKKDDLANAERAAGQSKGDPFDKIGSTVTEYMNSKPAVAVPAPAVASAAPAQAAESVGSAVSAASNAAASVQSTLSALRPKPF